MDLWRMSGVGGLQVPGFVLNSSFLPDTEQSQNPPAAPVWNILPSFPIWFYSAQSLQVGSTGVPCATHWVVGGGGRGRHNLKVAGGELSERAEAWIVGT